MTHHIYRTSDVVASLGMFLSAQNLWVTQNKFISADDGLWVIQKTSQNHIGGKV